jgi:AraC-like DNA-binding protein
VVPNPPDGPAHLRHAAVSKAELAHHCALLAVDEPPKDFALEGRRQHRNVLRPIQQPKEPDDRIEHLANMAGMSLTSFHRHFLEVTSLSPLQFQKQIRLQEARYRLLLSSQDVATVGFAVG